MKKISDLIPGNFQAIALANFIRDNRVAYEILPHFYGGAFHKIEITDSRFAKEILFVASQSL